MPKVHAAETAIVKIIKLLATNPPLSQEQITQRLAINRTTVSRRLAELKATTLVEHRPNPREPRETLWEPNFLGLLMVYTWLVNEDPLNIDIERMATHYAHKWIILQEYPYIKSDPNVHKILNQNVRTTYPFWVWSHPRGFVSTYQDYIQIAGNMRTGIMPHLNPISVGNHIALQEVFKDQITNAVIGLDAFMLTLVYNTWAISVLHHLLGEPNFKEYIGIQLDVEDQRHEVIQAFRRKHFGGSESA